MSRYVTQHVALDLILPVYKVRMSAGAQAWSCDSLLSPIAAHLLHTSPAA